MALDSAICSRPIQKIPAGAPPLLFYGPQAAVMGQSKKLRIFG
jgi:hypothetical protein